MIIPNFTQSYIVHTALHESVSQPKQQPENHKTEIYTV